MFALTGSLVHVGADLLTGMAVLVEQGQITALVPANAIPTEAERVTLDGGVLAAGFIDTQVNGGGGVLFNDAPDVATLRAMGAAHRRFGTTGFLPTIISDDAAVLRAAVAAVREAIAQGVPGVLGIHIEGPMLAPARRGIHDPRFFRGGDAEMLEIACSLGTGCTLVTLAPEMAGEAAIARLHAAGVIVAAGHTDATYDQMQGAFAAGLSAVTHLFNAMPPLTGRTPGVVGAALEHRELWCGIIVDGVHVHPATLRLALGSRPVDRFVLVTDAMSTVGTDMAGFDLQGRAIHVAGDRLVDAAGTLAGSNLTMAGAVRNTADLLDQPLPTALRLAAASPAAMLGIAGQRGMIAPGLAADLVWLDDDRRVRATWIAGERSDAGER